MLTTIIVGSGEASELRVRTASVQYGSCATQGLELPLTDQERSIDQAAAAAVGESLRDFFRRPAANWVSDVLADRRRITFTSNRRSASSTRSKRLTITRSRAWPASLEDMSSPPVATERYDPSYRDSSQFESSHEALDRWLVRYAAQSERRNAARRFVLTDGAAVIDYYALLAASSTTVRLARACRATARSGRNPRRRRPSSAPRPRRHAVTRRDATRRDATRSVSGPPLFYEHFGFHALSATPCTLMVTLTELRAAGYPWTGPARG